MDKIQKACNVLKEEGVDIAILSSIENVTYLSGFEMPLHSAGLSCIGYSAPLAVVLLDVRNEKQVMVSCVEFKSRIESQAPDLDTSYFLLFGNLVETDTFKNYCDALDRAMLMLGISKQSRVSIGLEYPSCPFFLANHIAGCYPNISNCDITQKMETVRRIKTNDEIENLRRIAALLDVGQETFNTLMQKPFIREFDIFSGVKQAIERSAGTLVPISGELVMGERTNAVKWPGGPMDREVVTGDSAILDISPRLRGYWGDCSNVAVYCREPDKKQKHYFKVVKETFDDICGILKPGLVCSDIAERIIKDYGKYGFKIPHYCGHQVGVNVNEEPRFVTYDHTRIEAGMVFCLELGLYEGEGGTTGVRCEKMILIREDGCEILNKFDWGIPL